MKIEFKRQEGGIQYVILALIVFFALFLTGSLFVKSQVVDPVNNPAQGAVARCCDSGDGPNCKPQTGEGQTFEFRGTQYGLLRSNAKFVEGQIHLENSGETGPGGKPIILNDSGRMDYRDPRASYVSDECKPPGRDKYFGKSVRPEDVNTPAAGAFCVTTAEDALIFVCKLNCVPAACPALPPGYSWIGGIPNCYGTTDSVYDIYYKLSEYEKNGKVEDFIAKCDKSLILPPGEQIVPGAGQEIILPPGNPEIQRLQLDTFLIKESSSAAYVPWVSPYCKPAIYLYPEKTMSINVKVNPVGPMTYTIPPYPDDGWNVIAYPNGQLNQAKNHEPITNNYLYYEAEIPDSEITEPNEGYVVKYDELEQLFDMLLPKLGLNKKESTQFKEYWLDVLPKAPYYSVKIIPESNLDHIAPLTFSVKPDSIKRVTLSFAPLESKIKLAEPKIIPFKRTGFTVIEWGGIFKRNKKYDFSCFM